MRPGNLGGLGDELLRQSNQLAKIEESLGSQQRREAAARQAAAAKKPGLVSKIKSWLGGKKKPVVVKRPPMNGYFMGWTYF